MGTITSAELSPTGGTTGDGADRGDNLNLGGLIGGVVGALIAAALFVLTIYLVVVGFYLKGFY
jgi:hypothetical protein